MVYETLKVAFSQEDFDNDVDALLEEGLPVAKKMRMSEDKYTGDSDHQSDGESGVQPMMTKIKTVLKSESDRTARYRFAISSAHLDLVLCANDQHICPIIF